MADERGEPEHDLFHEIEHGAGDYTDAELLEQAQLNAQALLLATVELLGDRQDVLATWRDGLAAIFLRAWDVEREWSPSAILDALLTNMRAYGAVVIEHDSQAVPATATIAGLPDPALVASLWLDPANVQELFMTAAAIARHLGGSLDWTIEPASGEIRLTVNSGEERA